MPSEIAVPVTALYAAFAAAWLVILTLPIVVLRQRHRVGLGAGDREDLKRAQRVHGNAAEWMPLGLVLILVVELLGAPVWLLHAQGGLLVAGRVLHALGLWTSSGRSFGRATGVLLQWAQYGLGAGSALWFAHLAG